MTFRIPETLRSFIPLSPQSHFPIQNLPYGVFRRRAGDDAAVGVAIGDYVLDLSVLEHSRLLDVSGGGESVFGHESLNRFMTMGPRTWRETRGTITKLLREDEPTLRDNARLRDRALLHMNDVEMQLPAQIGDYTDFYSSREHATNVGIMFRGKENALQPNWLHLPVGYHGRSSSIVVSGTEIHRPQGQTKPDDADVPEYGASRSLDFELEMGFFIGPGNPQGRAVPIDNAIDHMFGMVIVNDWSARDIQKWEYVPLGPFLAKNFATSISPWIVTMDALDAFRTSGPKQDPQPLPYLRSTGEWAYDIKLEVWLQTAKMDKPHRISATNYKNMYWNICQQLAHHTVNGCNMREGDLLASGTISGSNPGSYGSLLELAWKGTKPITLPNGETRSFLQDGDRVTMTAWCEGAGYRIGFGEVTGKITPAQNGG